MRWAIVVGIAALGLASCTVASHERYSDISDVAASPNQDFLYSVGRSCCRRRVCLADAALVFQFTSDG